MADELPDQKSKKESRNVFLIFVIFFGVVVLVNSVFIYYALNSHTGVIVEKPYEKGLAYNETLSKAKSQPQVLDAMSYEEGYLMWTLLDAQQRYIEDAVAKVRIVRPVQDGYDFDVELIYSEKGQYKAKLDLPLKGQWRAHMKMTVGDITYQSIYDFEAQ